MWKKIYLEGLFSEPTDHINIKEYEDSLKKLPKKIYKYLSIDNNYVFDNLEKNILTCSRPNDFNDPYDCVIFMNLENLINKDKNYIRMKDNCERVLSGIKNISLYNKFREQMNKELKKYKNGILENVKNTKNKIAIGCLSEKNDSILMWSHYAYNHSGFCVEYNFNQIQTSIGCVVPAIYTNNPSNLDISTIRKNNGVDIITPWVIKAKDWAYEQEWRIVKTDMKLCEARRFVKMPKPTAIYIGCKINAINEKKIVKLCIEKDIQVYKMIMRDDSFKLEYLPIREYEISKLIRLGKVISNISFKYSLIGLNQQLKNIVFTHKYDKIMRRN